jgi:hypothetical protein
VLGPVVGDSLGIALGSLDGRDEDDIVVGELVGKVGATVSGELVGKSVNPATGVKVTGKEEGLAEGVFVAGFAVVGEVEGAEVGALVLAALVGVEGEGEEVGFLVGVALEGFLVGLH